MFSVSMISINKELNVLLLLSLISVCHYIVCIQKHTDTQVSTTFKLTHVQRITATNTNTEKKNKIKEEKLKGHLF